VRPGWGMRFRQPLRGGETGPDGSIAGVGLCIAAVILTGFIWVHNK
jgi:hypothetical protein